MNFKRWFSEAKRLAKEYALCKGALDVAHVMGDARLYSTELPSESAAWEALAKHLKNAADIQGESRPS